MANRLRKEPQMNVEVSTCALSRSATDWDSIQWKTVGKRVKRLQMRIAKAVQEGRFHKAKSLQWILTHSHAAKLLAVRRVTTNKGKRTPGVDGVVWTTSSQKMHAVQYLRRRGYKARPLQRTYIPKKNGKQRPLSIPVVHDRAMQALHTLGLQPIAETRGDTHSYGFRVGRNCADAIGQCFNCLANPPCAQWILEGDIKSCFDKISHRWILKNIPMDRTMLKAWLKAGYLERRHFFHTTEGTPQGGIISPAIMNMTLDGLQEAIERSVPYYLPGTRTSPGVNVIRYADDFIVTGKTRELLEKNVLPAIKSFLKERGLTLSEEKTRITHINDGFTFLGQHLRKYNGVLIIQPDKEAIKGVIAKTKTVIKAYRGQPAHAIIKKLNPIITGWVNYHRYISAGKAFAWVDHCIFRQLWRWAKREHPHKKGRWIRKKYFRASGAYQWVMSVSYHLKGGTQRTVELRRASGSPLAHRMKIRSDANPFLPKWQVYFISRKKDKNTRLKIRNQPRPNLCKSAV